MTRAPRALVTDGEERAALAACRGLRLAGYEVTVARHSRLAPAAWSRSCERRIFLPDPRNSPREFADQLVEQIKRHEWDVLLPGSEASLLPISTYRDELEPHVTIGLPPHPLVVDSLDKVLLQERAAEVGLAPPPSMVCESPQAAEEAAARFGFPVVLKPTRSYHETRGALRQRLSEIVSDPRALETSLRRLGFPLLVQQFAREPRLVSCAGVLTDAGLAGFTVTRYQRTWPPSGGNASFATTVAPPGGLRELVGRLVASFGWRGIFELELLQLGERFGALDLNPRVFGWLSLAIWAGANLPAIWCDHVLGRLTRSADAAPGRRYRWEEGEVKYVLRNLRRGDIRALSPIRPHRRVVHACFQLRDPAPLVAQALLAAQRASTNAASRRDAG